MAPVLNISSKVQENFENSPPANSNIINSTSIWCKSTKCVRAKFQFVSVHQMCKSKILICSNSSEIKINSKLIPRCTTLL